ncbi:MAG: hypothetical protein LC640_08450 [Frankia sp.]|nr:hypothetical protein [Frankia sp.]
MRLTHTPGLVIGRGARIGSNCTILHGVTIGGSGRAWFDPTFDDGFPEIGDDCEIYAGAKLLGPITVGRGCFIGANAVLGHDLPDGAAYTANAQVSALRRKVADLEARLVELEARAAAQSGDAVSGKTASGS